MIVAEKPKEKQNAVFKWHVSELNNRYDRFYAKARFPGMKLVLPQSGFNASFYCNDGLFYC